MSADLQALHSREIPTNLRLAKETTMIRTGNEYRQSIRDGREVYVNGERVRDVTAVGEVWSLYGGRDVLNEIDPQFSANVETHIKRVVARDPFHVSANTDPKGDRSKPPQE
jgi:aromatic ring hydroxylase